jgi:fermentation-respiration switch protein FrsA (DUF1100 family)
MKNPTARIQMIERFNAGWIDFADRGAHARKGSISIEQAVTTLQADQDSYDFAHQAQATLAPAWRNEVTMDSLEAILEHAPGRFIDLVAPRPLLMILAKDDAITPPDSIRQAFNRAGGTKRLLEIEGGYYGRLPRRRRQDGSKGCN